MAGSALNAGSCLLRRLSASCSNQSLSALASWRNTGVYVARSVSTTPDDNLLRPSTASGSANEASTSLSSLLGGSSCGGLPAGVGRGLQQAPFHLPFGLLYMPLDWRQASVLDVPDQREPETGLHAPGAAHSETLQCINIGTWRKLKTKKHRIKKKRRLLRGKSKK